MQLVVDTRGTEISVRNRCFYVLQGDVNRIISPSRVSTIAVTSNAKLSSSALKLAASHDIPIYLMNTFGNLEALVVPGNSSEAGLLRQKQYSFSESFQGLKFLTSLIILKCELQLRNARKLENRASKMLLEELETVTEATKVRLLSFDMDASKSVIFGLEGRISKLYFGIVRHAMPSDFYFDKRSRRPAKDFFNAGLNYCYGCTYNQIIKSILSAKLDPFMGMLHVEGNKKMALVYDLIEPFRPCIDDFWIDCIQSNKIDGSLFEKKASSVVLSKKGKRVIVDLFNENLKLRIKLEARVMSLESHIYRKSHELRLIINDYVPH